jgi:Mrp family chromosome partitioning ATPase/capsular polysaccharide biosynthesis protein/cell division septation protein DedD
MFREYWRVLNKRKLTVIFSAILMGLFFVIFTRILAPAPIYSSSCTISFQKEPAIEGLYPWTITWTEGDYLEAQAAIITGDKILEQVAFKLGILAGAGNGNDRNPAPAIEGLKTRITVEREPHTNVLKIIAVDSDPLTAQRIADESAAAYKRYHSEQQTKLIIDAVKYLEEKLAGLYLDLKSSEEAINSISQENRTEYDLLKKKTDSLRVLIVQLEQKKQEALIRKEEKPEEVVILRPALSPSIPLNPPKTVAAGIIGAMIGLVIGLILIPILEASGSSLGAIEAVEETIDTRVLGVIPLADAREITVYLKNRFPGKADKSSFKNFIDLVTHFAPRSTISEGFRVLRTNILSGETKNRIKTIAITSASQGEGKTLVAVNLAISLAQAGLKTLLIEADMRRPAIAKVFGIEERTGLTDIMLGNFPWRDTVKTITDIIMGKMAMDDIMRTPGLDNINIITSGGMPPNPAELIGSESFVNFLKDAKKEYAFIILDSTPVLAAADAAILGEKVDEVFIVYRINVVSGNLLKRAVARLGQVQCNVAGVILNGSKPDTFAYFKGDRIEKHHKGMFSFFRRDSKTGEDEHHDRLDKTSPLFIRGAIILGVVLLLAFAAFYLSGRHPSSKKTQIEKGTIETTTSIKPPEPKETGESGKEPAYPQHSLSDLKSPFQQPAIKAETSHKNASASEINNEPGSFPFSVYLGSFKTKAKAQATVNACKQKGIPGFWVKVNSQEIGVWHRIYAGCFKDRVQAESFIKDHALKDTEVKKTAYANLLGKYKNVNDLNKMIQSLDDLGYSPYAIEGPDSEQKLFVGAFMTSAGAEEQNAELKSRGIECRVVKR